MVQPGWFDRQSKSVSEEIKTWPEWMKRAAGLEDRQSTALSAQPTDEDEGDEQPSAQGDAAS